MTELSTAVCSITATQRRRFFWAAWWTGAPSYAPFRKPDASSGGALSLDAALAEAERVAQRHLTVVESHWARAWKSVLRGQVPIAPASSNRQERAKKTVGASARESAWSVLGLQPSATLSELKAAFRKRALETHPDQGGDAATFVAAHQAYEKLLARFERRQVRRRANTTK